MNTYALKNNVSTVLTVLRNPLRAYKQWKWEKEWSEKKKRETENEQLVFDELLANTPHIVSLTKTEERMCYDSKWEVVYLDNGVEMVTVITRHDFEKRVDLLRELASADTLDAIAALDERHRIYYD